MSIPQIKKDFANFTEFKKKCENLNRKEYFVPAKMFERNLYLSKSYIKTDSENLQKQRLKFQK